jgi:phosphonate transport system substrate-binding protein
MPLKSLAFLMIIFWLSIPLSLAITTESSSIGTATNPLQMSMIPLTQDGEQAIQYLKPLFDAITQEFDIHFQLDVGESYEAVIEAFCKNQVQLALLGTYSYGEVKKRCHHGELLAVEVKNGRSTYYSGIFIHKKNQFKTLKDLKGQTIAFGSQYSTSSFIFPIAMLMEAKIHPANDFANVFVTNSHSASIKALATGKVIAASASFNAWLKAVEHRIVDPLYFKALAKFPPIPNAPLVMNKNLPNPLKEKLRDAFQMIHTKLGTDELLDVLGKKIDRYDVNIDEKLYRNLLKKLERVTEEVKQSVLEKAN